MNPDVRAAIDAHALRDYPRESCGLVAIVDGVETYFPCRNIGKTASEHFVMDHRDYADVEDQGEITLLVHSHPNLPAKPSQGDLVACEESGLPWLIIAVWKEPEDLRPRVAADYMFQPSGYEAPLVGREFHFGILDCYTLVRDWHKRELGVEIPDFERRDEFWTKKGGPMVDLYAQYEQAGFVDVTGQPLQVGDCPLIQIRAPFANHAGVYIGEGLLLQHLHGKLSSRDPYFHSFYQERTRKVVRYVGGS